MADEKIEFYVETRQVVYRDCRVMASDEKEARSLVLAGKADLVVVRPIETHKITNSWPLAVESRQIAQPVAPPFKE